MPITDIKLDRNLPTTIGTQICDQLRNSIGRGDLEPGTQIPNAREWCKELGVAYPTLSKSLQLLVREGLLVRIPSSGTFVRSTPAAIKNIAITYDSTVHTVHEPWLERVLSGIHLAAEPLKWQMQLFPLKNAEIFGQGYETLISRLLRSHEISGLIACSPHNIDDMLQLERLGVPTVSYRNQYFQTNIPWIMEDVDAGAAMLVRHVVDDLKHRQIRLVMGSEPAVFRSVTRSSVKLAEALIRELEWRGISLTDNDIAYSHFEWTRVRAAVHAWLMRPQSRPTCIIFCSDSLALEAIALARSLGIRVPETLSIASYGDVLPHANLTSVHVPLEDMGQCLVDELSASITREPSELGYSPVELRIRTSTAISVDATV